MLSNKSNYIRDLYQDKTWRPNIVKILVKVTNYVGLTDTNIKDAIEANLKSKNSDKKIIETLRDIVTKHT